MVLPVVWGAVSQASDQPTDSFWDGKVFAYPWKKLKAYLPLCLSLLWTPSTQVLVWHEAGVRLVLCTQNSIGTKLYESKMYLKPRLYLRGRQL